MPSKYRDMDEVKAAFPKFFQPEALRGFHSRIGSFLVKGRYFVTSERRNKQEPRGYTVRRIEDWDSINSIVPFQTFRTAAQAYQYISTLADYPAPCANCKRLTFRANFTCDSCRVLKRPGICDYDWCGHTATTYRTDASKYGFTVYQYACFWHKYSDSRLLSTDKQICCYREPGTEQPCELEATRIRHVKSGDSMLAYFYCDKHMPERAHA